MELYASDYRGTPRYPFHYQVHQNSPLAAACDKAIEQAERLPTLEFEQLIGYHPTKEYWWQGKYPSRFENI